MKPKRTVGIGADYILWTPMPCFSLKQLRTRFCRSSENRDALMTDPLEM